MNQFLAYLQLLRLATPLAVEATKIIQQTVPNVAGTAKLQYVLSAVQTGLKDVNDLVATADQLTPIVNAAVALHKTIGTEGFTAAS